jgi:sulfur-carrier protein adenylyltransferase/sulfurtransferase
MATGYYQSHEKLSFIGKAGQQQLQKAKVLVIGAGGLGCPALQFLTGCGIGVISVADFDIISESNLHRQFLYNVDDIGKPKASTAVKKLSAYNPQVQFNIHDTIIHETNVLSIVTEYDLIVDCTDNFTARYLINDACIVLDKPLVYGAIHQTEGHVTVFNYKGLPTLRCLFPEANESIQSCADIGAYNMITGIIGIMMANEVIKIILGHEDVLAGKLNQFDVLTGITKQIKYPGNNDSRKKSIDRFQQANASIEISPESLQEKITNKEKFLLVDVREKTEHDEFNIGGEHIPLNELLRSSLSNISSQALIITYCQSGERSLQAAKSLIDKGFATSFSLKGGMQYWKAFIASNRIS